MTKWTMWTMMLVMLASAMAMAQTPTPTTPDASALCVALALDLNETLAQVPKEANTEVAKAQTYIVQARVLRLSALGAFLTCDEGRRPYAKLDYTLPAAAERSYKTIFERLVAHVRARKPLSPPTPRTCRWLFVAFATAQGSAKDAVVGLHARMGCPATADTMPDFVDLPEWPQ